MRDGQTMLRVYTEMAILDLAALVRGVQEAKGCLSLGSQIRRAAGSALLSRVPRAALVVHSSTTLQTLSSVRLAWAAWGALSVRSLRAGRGEQMLGTGNRSRWETLGSFGFPQPNQGSRQTPPSRNCLASAVAPVGQGSDQVAGSLAYDCPRSFQLIGSRLPLDPSGLLLLVTGREGLMPLAHVEVVVP